MSRVPQWLTSAASVAVATLAVTVAVPAMADDGNGAGPAPNADEQRVRACLSDQGAELPAGDGRDLKQWIFEHSEDAALRNAMNACGLLPTPKPTVVAGETRSCDDGGKEEAAKAAKRAGEAKDAADEKDAEVAGGQDPATL